MIAASSGRPFLVRPARAADAKDPLFRHALETDPDGAFVAEGGDGAVLGRAAALARDATLRIALLEVSDAARGAGIGTTLLEAVRAYGASRGTTVSEAEIPLVPASLAFAAKRRLGARSLVLALELAGSEAHAPPSDLALEPFVPGAGLSGWVASLEREARGYARAADWSHWLRRRGGRALTWKRGGRPEGIAALFVTGDRAHAGPLVARTPTAAATALGPLVAAARAEGVSKVTLSVSAEARLLLDVALAHGFRVTGARALLTTRRAGDARRNLGGPDFF